MESDLEQLSKLKRLLYFFLILDSFIKIFIVFITFLTITAVLYFLLSYIIYSDC